MVVGNSGILADAEIILHIGAPKTGSSAVQKDFSQNQDALALSGYYYPPHELDPNGISGGHWQIASLLNEGNVGAVRDKICNYLLQARAVGCKLLLSAEGFFTHPDLLTVALVDFKYVVVSFYRHPLDSFRSSYNQDVKRHFYSQTIQTFSMSQACLKPAITGESLLRWAELAGPQRVVVLPYHDQAASDATGALSSFLGIQLSCRGQRINLSYTPCAVEFKRVLNSILNPLEQHLNGQVDFALQKYSDAVSPPRPSLEQLLGKECLRLLEDKYAPIVARISEVFGISVSHGQELDVGNHYESIDLVWAFVAKAPELGDYIRDCVFHALKSGDFSYDFLQLCRWVDLPFDALPFERRQLMRPEDLAASLDRSAQLADVYRELSKILERAGDYASALAIADRALGLRPDGPYLQLMVKRLKSVSESSSR
ncbi:hypothetical protein ACQUQU_09670 [Thalassolituus sp. LLYu03]|uniref:hypothetical protein n=1 Tax=Thalassolituus sp. LLYu03 TaxID=3421656 RepID=UPI003D26A5AF